MLALFTENGPLHIEDNDACSVVPNPASWNNDAHLLYWDQPVGTGYSYTIDKKYVKNEKQLRKQFYKGLQAFYGRHGYRSCPLYIAGESYSGKYITNIATEILERNAQGKPYIPLAGVAIGDGWIQPKLQTLEQIRYAFDMGFLDVKQKAEAMLKFARVKKQLKKGNMGKANKLTNEIIAQILACGGHPFIYDVRRWGDLTYDSLACYLSKGEVKSALGIPRDLKWRSADDAGPVSKNLNDDVMVDAAPLLPGLLKEIKVLLYTGNFDMSCGYNGVEKLLYKLKWPYREKWRAAARIVWVLPPETTLGFVKSCDKLTQVVIPDAGHMVPVDKPWVSRHMLYNWIFDREFTGKVPSWN